MRSSALHELMGIEVPIVQAPIGLAAGATLAAAVSNAGGLGTVAMTGRDADEARRVLRQTQSMTTRPFAANFILEFPHRELVEISIDEGVPVISVFWGDPARVIETAHAAGVLVMVQVGSVDEAQRAADAGADVVVAQGYEAGGHVRGDIATMVLVPAVVDAVAPTPVVAAGGIGDGRGLAAVLALGAAGAWMGTRFLFSEEAALHPTYVEALRAATASDTVHTTVFDQGWPDAPHRTIRNSTVTQWEAAGRPPSGDRPGEGEVVAASASGAEVHRYEPWTVSADFSGDIETVSMWAGQCVGLIDRQQPARTIVHEIVTQAEAVLTRLA